MTEKQDYHKDRHYIIIAGPTASGKSAMALDIARRMGGVIINADSMQIYQDLSVLTARPSEVDMQAVPHRLYGVMDGAQNCSVGKWLALAHEEVTLAWQAGKMPILVGGTGMYLQAATDGLSPIPDIPEDVRKAVIAQHRKMGAEQFHTLLASHDNEIATRLFPTDTQRVLEPWKLCCILARHLVPGRKSHAFPELKQRLSVSGICRRVRLSMSGLKQGLIR